MYKHIIFLLVLAVSAGAGEKIIEIGDEMVRPTKKLAIPQSLYALRNLKAYYGELVKDGSQVVIVTGDYVSKKLFGEVVIDIELCLMRSYDPRESGNDYYIVVPIQIVRPVKNVLNRFIGVGTNMGSLDKSGYVLGYCVKTFSLRGFRQKIDRGEDKK